MGEPQIAWSEPREVVAWRSRAKARYLRKGLPWGLAVAACLVLPALALMPRHLITWMWAGCFGSVVIAFVGMSLQVALRRRYKLSATGIYRFGGSCWPWKMLQGYRVAEYPLVPSCRSLLLYAKKGPPRHLPLPNPLSRWAATFLYALTLAFGVGVGYALSTRLGKGLTAVALVAPVVLGPGTIGFALLYRREFFRRRCWAPALLFNALGWLLMWLYAALFVLRDLQDG